ncbi:aldehyde ferredoxin oxidoreductase [Candidatus Atribacteria bacterium HGW-Atribacteria-1]|nr:MAG: aldehyde ferredoxin oxidoreductase [Candidatus Atribacteria bacterium HGW-Atribacteria-1]
MSYGYTGNILHIDLSSKKQWIEKPPENFYRTYWGGRALALYYMLNQMKPKTDPLSPDNLLIFAPSVITGTPAPAIPRYTVCAKSPLTGAEGEAEAGGWWGPELKKAGFDVIIIKGSSSVPVYLYIEDGKIEIKDATHLWGKDTGETQKIIKEELTDDKIRIAQIGPAGENLVRFANIVNELKHFNGRNGLGAVMGSKKLKAIAVRGTKPIDLFNKEKIGQITQEITKRIMNNPLSRDLRELGTPAVVRGFYEAGCLPSYNWTTGYFKEGENLTAETLNKTILKGTKGCFACPIRCKRVVEVDEPGLKVDPLYGGPEYETIASLGSLCGISDLKYIAKANELCNKYTMDTISTGMVIAFAMQCYQEGILTKEDTDGIELTFGNKEALLTLIEKIAYREGLGDLLSQGSYFAAQKIGKGAEKFIHQVKGQEIPMHDPRLKTGVGLQYALSDYGADHMKAPHDTFFKDKDSIGIKEMKGLGILEPVSPTDLGEKKVALFKLWDIYWSLLDILGVCVFGYVPRTLGTLDELLEIIRSTTGWKTTWFELMQVGERSINMARIFNYREGFTSQDDTLPEVFYHNFKGGPLDGQGAINKEDLQKALRLRYELMGWNPDTGIPTIAKLIELGLDWLIDKLK